MKNVKPRFIFPLLVSLVALSCQLDELEPPKPDLRPASTPVINEVFTLPHDRQNTFWWIEFFNPTRDTFDLTGWTISLTTHSVDYFQVISGRLDSVIRIDTSRLFDTLGNHLGDTVTIDTLRRVSLASLAEFYSYPPDTGKFDVPFAEGVYNAQMYYTPVEVGERIILPPNGLFTIVSSTARLEQYSRWGEGDSRLRREKNAQTFPLQIVSVPPYGVFDLANIVRNGAFRGPVYNVDTLVPTRINQLVTSPGVRVGYDTLRTRISSGAFVVTRITIFDTIKTVTIIDTLGYWAKAYAFNLHPKDQLILKNATGQIVDVVRIGPAGDSLFANQSNISPLLGPSNQPIPTPPEFESVARYMGGYFTGNTSNDFYSTVSPFLPPIPHGRNGVAKGRR